MRTKTGVDPRLPREEYLALLAKGMSEAALLARIMDAITPSKKSGRPPLPGVLAYHVPDSRKVTADGFPDLHLVLGSRVEYWELKTMTGRLRADQVVYRDMLLAAGETWRLIRPTEWVDGTCTRLLTEHLRAT